LTDDFSPRQNSASGPSFTRTEGHEAIILAGGLGTRLRDTIPGLPKCMAPVAGMPFLKHVIRWLLAQGVEKYIFSLGYKHEIIENFLSEEFPTVDYQLAVEKEPLGTGGAIRLACERVQADDALIVNGDTLFKISAAELFSFHRQFDADCTLALKPMKEFDRYGVVEIDQDSRVRNFREKQYYDTGDINGGVYVLNVKRFMNEDLPSKFSFEKEWLEKFCGSRKISAIIRDEYFIDIGIPPDYAKAQQELSQIPLHLENIDAGWTLFLDRDGVINYEKENDYIYNWDEFEFYPGVIESLPLLSKKFERIIVISNQRGVGRGLMSEESLLDIHGRMKSELENNGGRVDRVYYCIAADPKDFYRKPNPGMAIRAAQEFPEIDLSKSIMVGNKPSDMQFGRNAGCYTVYLKTTHPDQPIPHPDIDLVFDSLLEFAKAL
jgi:D-glycero-alpha-D-manno-heptose 1-phosphate guanylyltransferase